MVEFARKADGSGRKALSEYDSKLLLEKAGIPFVPQGLAKSREEALGIARRIGFPVVMKGCSDQIAHKSEMGLVRLNIQDEPEAAEAYGELSARGLPLDGVLVTKMIDTNREFVLGLSRDPQFGPYVMFGLGGVYTEALHDVAFRIAPLNRFDAEEMMGEIQSSALLDEFRGEPAVNKSLLADILMGIGQLGLLNPEIAEIDINPMVPFRGGMVALDALVILEDERAIPS